MKLAIFGMVLLIVAVAFTDNVHAGLLRRRNYRYQPQQLSPAKQAPMQAPAKQAPMQAPYQDWRPLEDRVRALEFRVFGR